MDDTLPNAQTIQPILNIQKNWQKTELKYWKFNIVDGWVHEMHFVHLVGIAIIVTVKIQTMQIKQKIIKGDPTKNRYGLQPTKNCDSTPGLLKSKELNKQNNINMRNNEHNRINENTMRSKHEEISKGQLQTMRSMEVPRRLRTSVNDQEGGTRRGEAGGLLSSQELFHFRQRNRNNKHESATFPEHLTFGQASRRPLMTSRQFQQEKAIKNEVIDELITNARRQLCKSFNQFSTSGTGSCANHPGKKAKYRLVSELSQGQEEMFYCSKCAINLLQQGFPIQEMKGQQLPSAALLRGQQVAKFELRLRSIEQRTKGEAELNERKEDLQLVQEEIFNCNKKFGQIFELLEAIRKDRISSLNATYAKLESQKQGRRQGLQSMMCSLGDLQREIEDYRATNRFATMRENEFQFLATTLSNKLAAFEETLASARTPTPRHRLSLELTSAQGILEKLKTALQKGDNPRTRRERQATFQRREGQTSGEEDFGCDQLKKPFRILFPAEEGEHQKRSMLNSVRECPSFGQYP